MSFMVLVGNASRAPRRPIARVGVGGRLVRATTLMRSTASTLMKDLDVAVRFHDTANDDERRFDVHAEARAKDAPIVSAPDLRGRAESAPPSELEIPILEKTRRPRTVARAVLKAVRVGGEVALPRVASADAMRDGSRRRPRAIELFSKYHAPSLR